jgi:hypothetical protein
MRQEAGWSAAEAVWAQRDRPHLESAIALRLRRSPKLALAMSISTPEADQ